MSNTLWASLCDCAVEMARDALRDIGTRDDWEHIRPHRHREFMHGLGLDPLPQRCELDLSDRGGFAGKGFTGRRLAFRILPDCWTSACVYYPDPRPSKPAPAVLYVCGHGGLGSHALQYHPILWARRGYVSLIVDTVEQGDNPGEHHAFAIGKHNEWMALGYTPAGGEVWNAMRALDVLAADPLVDPERLAVTGVSGGGACSFHLAIADERIKAVSTLCGISTPVDAIVHRHLISHCNCMYPYNLYRRDISAYAALIAPRAALFCFADDDQIFHLSEAAALVERTAAVYGLYGAASRCRLVTCPGGHGDHVEFDDATAEWFDIHVAGETHPAVARGHGELSESETTVFNGQPPAPNRTHLLPHLLSTQGTVPLPESAADWPEIRRAALDALPPLPEDAAGATLAPDGTWKRPDSRLTSHRGCIAGVEVWLHTLQPDTADGRLILGVAGAGEGSMDLMGHIAAAAGTAPVTTAGLEGRIGGLTYGADEDDAPHNEPLRWSIRKLLPFALPLTGATPVMLTLADIGIALDYLLADPDAPFSTVYLYGKGDAGVAALYRGLIDERVAGVIVENAPRSHVDSAPILGILRAFDMPHAVGLMAPRRVALIHPGHGYWTWPSRVYERLGCPDNFLVAGDLQTALARMS